MAGVTGFNASEDVRHARRALSVVELAKLLNAASEGPVRYHMSGTDKVLAYRIAIGTGFRVNEIRSLTLASFRLDGDCPVILLQAKSAKDRRRVEQPIAPDLAADLAAWLVGKPAGVPVLPLHHETAKMIRRDLEAAGIPYKLEEGFADFHSLRATFINFLIKSGASIKTVQALARHKKPTTTLTHYAKADPDAIAGAVHSLPSFPGGPKEAAGGIGGPAVLPIEDRFADYLPKMGRGPTRPDAAIGETGSLVSGDQEKPGPPETPDSQGLGRPLAASGGITAERTERQLNFLSPGCEIGSCLSSVCSAHPE